MGHNVKLPKPHHTRMRLFLTFLLILLCCQACEKPAGPGNAQVVTAAVPTPARPTVEPATFTGSEACQYCHTPVYEAWLSSQHHQAMMPIPGSPVLGDFNHTTLTHHGQQTEFLMKDNRPIIRTDQQTQSPAELELHYTFGIFPLQQYLAPLPDGRWQALPFAWDSRAADAGGQRWFHLYAGEAIVPGDVLHWNSPSHNANHMCIECHTTGFRKNHDPGTGRFASSWTEAGVGCEGCHGPGSRHIAWARSPDKSAFSNKGWETDLASGGMALWQRQSGSTPPHRSTPANHTQVERCAQCHSRRSRIHADDYSTTYLDNFIPALLDETLYHADGQIQDEVFEYGSFLQSRMHQAGVTCSNCHDAHRGTLVTEGNGLCLQCHSTEHDSPAHTLHSSGTPGSFCVDCHMPATVYMQVDARRDHSFRKPRPDLHESLGTPDACTGCHQDKSPGWASAVLDQRRGETWRTPHYGPTLAQARLGLPGVYNTLLTLINDSSEPAIVRATATSLLPQFPTRDYRQVLARQLAQADPLLRLAALRASENLPAAERSMLLPLLDDSVRSVRLETVRLVADLPEARQHPAFAAARREYLESQQLHSDRAPALVALAALAIREADWPTAETHLRKALQQEPYYIPAAINLADLYRQRGRDSEGDAVLKAALAKSPANPELNLAYGLRLVRAQDVNTAKQYLEAATREGRDPYYHYVYALALEPVSLAESLQVIDAGIALPAYRRELYLAGVEFALKNGEQERAKRYLAAWEDKDPDDPALPAWRQSITP